MIKHIPSTLIVLAEAGNNQDKRSTTVNGLASQWSPGLPNDLVNKNKLMVSPIH